MKRTSELGPLWMNSIRRCGASVAVRRKINSVVMSSTPKGRSQCSQDSSTKSICGSVNRRHLSKISDRISVYLGFVVAAADVQSAFAGAGVVLEGEDVGGNGGGKKVSGEAVICSGEQIQHQISVSRREVGEIQGGRNFRVSRRSRDSSIGGRGRSRRSEVERNG